MYVFYFLNELNMFTKRLCTVAEELCVEVSGVDSRSYPKPPNTVISDLQVSAAFLIPYSREQTQESLMYFLAPNF